MKVDADAGKIKRLAHDLHCLHHQVVLRITLLHQSGYLQRVTPAIVLPDHKLKSISKINRVEEGLDVMIAVRPLFHDP